MVTSGMDGDYRHGNISSPHFGARNLEPTGGEISVILKDYVRLVGKLSEFGNINLQTIEKPASIVSFS